MRSRYPLAIFAITLTTITLQASNASGVTRDKVMATAKAFAYHPWRCTTANLTASCSSSYKSEFAPGDYMGMPYDWGGFKSLFQFDQDIAAGEGAGSPPGGTVLGCTTGIDCSKYVCKCWHEGEYGTSTIMDIATALGSQSQLLPGDAMNRPPSSTAGGHIKLFSHKQSNGEPVFYHAGTYNVEIDVYGGWSSVSGFTPIRYSGITGTSAGNPVGTTENPIVISSFPYTDSRNTALSSSDVFDGCGAAPTKSESGPEYIYKVTFTQPGTLTVSVSDGPGTNPDIDVHLYTSMNTSDCVKRHDKTFTHQVDCGIYYIVADTFKEYAGSYTLTVDFSPSTTACGSGPPSYNFTAQAIGGVCDPTCNPNLGVDCSGFLICSKPCSSNADCSGIKNGCCKNVSGAGSYCLFPPFCSGLPIQSYNCPSGTCSQPTPVCLTSFFCTKPCTSHSDCPTKCCGGKYCLPSSKCGVTPPPDSGVPPKQDSGVPPKQDADIHKQDGHGPWPDGYVPTPDLPPVTGDGWQPPTGDGAKADGVGGENGDGDEGGCGCRVQASSHLKRTHLPLLVWVLVGLALLIRRRTQSCT